MRPTRPLYFMLNLAGSGHDFRGVCFSVAYTTPNGKSCRTFPKTRSIYHNSRCTYPIKRPQSLSDAKNAKRQGNTRLNQKNASESLSGRCITMHESDARSVSCVLNTERVKMTSFLPLNGWFCMGFRSHLPHGIFVKLQKKARQDQPDTLCSCQMRIAGYCVSTPVSSAVDDGDTVPP